MEDVRRHAPKRRTLLQRGAALLGGAIGLGGSAGAAAAADTEASDGTLRLFGWRRGQLRPGRGRVPTTPPSVHGGELRDAVDGPAVGTFQANAFLTEASLPGSPATPGLEIQTFALEGGTLFGLGAAPGPGGERACAVVGGTGRFARAQGSYVERPADDTRARQGLVEFVFRLS